MTVGTKKKSISENFTCKKVFNNKKGSNNKNLEQKTKELAYKKYSSFEKGSAY